MLICNLYDRFINVPFLLLSIYPSPPVILKIVSGVLQNRWPDGLAIASTDQVNQQAVKEVGHVVLLLPSSTLAKAFDEQNRL